jgi:hypothetical protein
MRFRRARHSDRRRADGRYRQKRRENLFHDITSLLGFPMVLI